MPLPRLRTFTLTLPAVAAFGVQLSWAFGPAGSGGLRMWLLLIAGIGSGLSLVLGRLPGAHPLPLSALAIAVPAVFWLTVLEYALTVTKPTALPLLLTLDAALVHTALALLVVREKADTGTFQRVLQKMTVVAATIALITSAAEFVLLRQHPLNLYAPQADDPSFGPCMVADATGRSVAVPGFRGRFMHHEFPGIRVEINAWGLRDDPREAEAPDADTLSILVLGDSFVFGVGVEHDEALDELLEARSSEFTDRRVLAYDAGIPGYGTIHERQRLAELAERVRPEVVLLGFYEGNDLDDNWTGEGLWGGVEDVSLHRQTKASLVERAREDARNRRRIGTYLEDALGVPFWERRSALAQQTRIFRRLTELGLLPPDPRVNDLMNLCLLREAPPVVEELRDACIRQLVAIKEDATRIGARLIVFLIPAQVQVDQERFETFVHSQLEHDPGEFSRTAFHQELLRRLEASGIEVVDTLPALEAETLAGRSSYHPEGHWNARGHSVAASLIIERLKRVDKR